MQISYYKNIKDDQDVDIEISSFIEGVRSGRWQDIVLDIRAAPNKEIRDLKKKTAPLVTISGSFAARKDDAIRAHSGYIAIDIDNLDNLEQMRKIINKDSYTYSCFTSISGNGLCVIYRIDGSRHLDAFNGIASYLYNNYQLIVDQSCKNVARARFVSYDPFISEHTKAP